MLLSFRFRPAVDGPSASPSASMDVAREGIGESSVSREGAGCKCGGEYATSLVWLAMASQAKDWPFKGTRRTKGTKTLGAVRVHDGRVGRDQTVKLWEAFFTFLASEKGCSSCSSYTWVY